ncbi:MAG: DNA polymerase I [Syntrophobacteraceae bacterium]
MEETRGSFYLIDGSSYIYRAFYALGKLTSTKGMPTQAVYGFAQMITKVMRDKNPSHVCVVFDAPGPNFRHELFTAYKGTRQKMPEDLVVQIPYIKELVRCHGLPQLEMTGYEADDLIARLARWGAEEGFRVVIVSADKDLHQLVHDPDILQWDPQKDRVFDEAAVQEKLGVTPVQVKDYLALVGDSSDNVPGVKGVGEKSARQLLQQHGTLDAIFNRIEAIAPASLQRKLMEGKDSAYLSRELVSFKTDIVLGESLEPYRPKPPLTADLIRLYEELSFKGLLDAIRSMMDHESPSAPKPPPARTLKTGLIGSGSQLQELAAQLGDTKRAAIDIIASPGGPTEADLEGIALCTIKGAALYMPFSEDAPLRDVQTLLAQESVVTVGEDLKFASMVLEKRGLHIPPLTFDTMLAAYLIQPGTQSPKLERVAAEYLEEALDFDPLPAAPDEPDTIAGAALTACSRAEVAWRLAPILRRKLEEHGLWDLFETIEMPLVEVLAAMETRGILIEAGKLAALSVDFQKALDAETAVIYDLAKEEFNIQSPKQLAYILFEKLGLRVLKKTKTGPSTDMSVLEELALEHPVPEHILTYRSLAKLKGTYVDSLPKLINPRTGRIHTSYNQTVTTTGRLSSSDPNLQNIPIRTEEGRKIREAFVAAPGHVLLSSDYSQIELRILAHYSGDERLKEAFLSGRDVHAHTAAEMFNITPMDVTPEMRRQAKMINFGIIYGMSAFGLAQRLRITQKIAKAAIERYFQRYSGVKAHIEASIESARECGYAETLLGRRRALPELQSRNHAIRQQGERLAVNTPIQGTAADLIKKAMIEIHAALRESRMKTMMLLQVHDELVFEVPSDELDQARELVRSRMEGVWPLTVPLKVDMGWGVNWAAAHP